VIPLEREKTIVNEESKIEAGEAIDAARDEKLSELDILKQSLEEKKKASEDYYNQLLRLKAEFDNFRRRTEKEKQNHLIWGKEEILLKQVSLLDVMEQAAASVMTAKNIESVQKGLELIKQEFVRMLTSEGITEIECKGKIFDPAVAEAMENVESDLPEGTVTEVMQKGYRLKDRVIRHAKVKVAKGKEGLEAGDTKEK
jgi:molecular chaperone GrpE